MARSPTSTASGGAKVLSSSVTSSVLTITSSLSSINFQCENGEQGNAKKDDGGNGDNDAGNDDSIGDDNNLIDATLVEPRGLKSDSSVVPGSAVRSVNLKSKLILDNRSDSSMDRRLFGKDEDNVQGSETYSRSLKGLMLDRLTNNGPIGINFNNNMESGSQYLSSYGIIGRTGRNELQMPSFKGDIPSIAASNANYLYRYQKRTGHDFSLVAPSEDASILSSVSHNMYGQKKKGTKSFHRQESSSEEESFIYHDLNTVSGTPTPEAGSLLNGGRRLQSPTRLNFNDAEFIKIAGDNLSPSDLSSPKINTRKNSFSHVRQISRRIFSKEKKYMGVSDMIPTRACSTIMPHKTSLPFTSYTQVRAGSVLSPIIDYGSADESTSPDIASYYERDGPCFLEESSGFSEDVELHSCSPHNYKSTYCRRGLIIQMIKCLLKRLFYSFLIIIFLLMAIRLFIFKYCDNGLVEFTLDHLENVLVSSEMLLFDINASARNLNMQSVDIWKMDVDVLMKTRSGVFQNSVSKYPLVDEDITIFLGNSLDFTTPLKFRGLFSLDTDEENSTVLFPTFKEFWSRLFREKYVLRQNTSGQVKIQWPGKDFKYKGAPLSPDQWNKILNSRFRLIIKGSFRYHLPLLSSDQVLIFSHEETLNPGTPENIP